MVVYAMVKLTSYCVCCVQLEGGLCPRRITLNYIHYILYGIFATPESQPKIYWITLTGVVVCFSLAATEIRCQEKSRGGLSYEVILAEPAPNVPVPKRPVTPGKNVSVEEIEQKLKAAEERRIVSGEYYSFKNRLIKLAPYFQSLEARKMAEISIKLAKVEEATRKKDEITNEFITQTKEQLESKMETHVEKREAIISDMKEKLKVRKARHQWKRTNFAYSLQIHAQEIEKTRETLEQQKANEQKAIEEKLKTAQALRDENIKKMLDRLKEHVSLAWSHPSINQFQVA